MKGENTELRAGGRHEIERLIYFSDAVMAIAMTLLVIDLRIPSSIDASATDAQLRTALADLGPRFLSFGISFAVIAVWWHGHHRLYRTLERTDGWVVVANFGFLGAIAFLPFPTSLIGRWVNLSTAVALYAATNLVAGGILLAMRWHAERRGFIEAQPPLERRRRMAMSALAPFGFALSIPLAFLHPAAVAVSWTLFLPAILAIRWRFNRLERRADANKPRR